MCTMVVCKHFNSHQGRQDNGGISMYGSICAGAADFIFRICGLTSHDCFLDIGSGLGQIVTQAAGWAGCRSLGVEVVRDRHQAAVRLYNMVKRETAGTALDVSALAQVRLIEGDFVDKWDEIKDCTVIYFNNERGWFKAPGGDPTKAKYSYECQLVSLLQQLGRSVTMVTMEKMDPSPQGWTHTEHIFGKPNGEKRVATFAAGSLNFHLYKVWEEMRQRDYSIRVTRLHRAIGLSKGQEVRKSAPAPILDSLAARLSTPSWGLE
ncbi:unnamed protein product [Ectocarpus sp. 12 AP-2014]